MRQFALAATVVAALVGAACAGAARADIFIPPNNPEGDTLTFTVESTVVDQVDPDAGIVTVDPDTGLTYPSGCKQVDVAAVAKSVLFQTVIYKFHQIKHWCWHKGVVYDERHAWSLTGSSTACLDTVYPANAWFFAWSGNAQGGHFSEERAHITNCIFKVGSWKEMYPDVKLWAHANGSFDQAIVNQ